MKILVKEKGYKFLNPKSNVNTNDIYNGITLTWVDVPVSEMQRMFNAPITETFKDEDKMMFKAIYKDSRFIDMAMVVGFINDEVLWDREGVINEY